jgi:hypothetical protein
MVFSEISCKWWIWFFMVFSNACCHFTSKYTVFANISFSPWCYKNPFKVTWIGIKTQVSDTDHIDRLISCLYMALPFFLVWTVFLITGILCILHLFLTLQLVPINLWTQRGASSSRFLNYLNKHIVPVFDKVVCYLLLLHYL